LVYVFLPEEDNAIIPCFPPAHEFEEAISLSDEEFEDPNEASLEYVVPTHEDKEMVIFTHTDSLIKETSDMVNGHIDAFIQIGRRVWDLGHFNFDGNPIYDIEGIPQENGFELSSS
jgi:hypothetical protein